MSKPEIPPNNVYVIWKLSDGREKYSLDIDGRVQVWTPRQLSILSESFESDGMAFSSDLKLIGDSSIMKSRLGKKFIVTIRSFRTEKADGNLNKDIIGSVYDPRF